MSFFSRIALLLMLLILSMTSFDSVGGFTFLRKRAYIKIFNDLGRGLDLVAHCKSDDDDLGAQLIKYPDGVLQFNFRPNAKGTTLFSYSTVNLIGQMCPFGLISTYLIETILNAVSAFGRLGQLVHVS